MRWWWNWSPTSTARWGRGQRWWLEETRIQHSINMISGFLWLVPSSAHHRNDKERYVLNLALHASLFKSSHSRGVISQQHIYLAQEHWCKTNRHFRSVNQFWYFLHSCQRLGSDNTLSVRASETELNNVCACACFDGSMFWTQMILCSVGAVCGLLLDLFFKTKCCGLR